MTTYNREKYVSFAIESVLGSTCNDFELLIVDDCSTDGTVEIARRYEQKDSRIRVVVNEKNLGDYPNRNRAASLARGYYLKYVDADDYIYPTGLQTLIDMMSRYPEAGYGLCSLLQLRNAPFPLCLSPTEAYRQHFFCSPIFHKAPLSSIIKKSAWDAVGGFSKEKMVSDADMWHRLSMQFDVVLMPLGIVWYRQHDDQEVSDLLRAPVHYAMRYDAVVQRALSSENAPLTVEEKQDICNRFRRMSVRQMIKNLVRGRLKEASLYASNALAFGRICTEVAGRA
ncbi:glycosyltransferase family 2 protein [Rosistilla oblonga]